jgi:hypothetical protein
MRIWRLCRISLHCFKNELLVKIATGFNIYVILLHDSRLKCFTEFYASLLPNCLLTAHLCTSSST